MSDMVAADFPIGGFVRRLTALAIDGFILGIVEFLVNTEPNSTLSSVLDYLLWIIAAVAYLVIGQAVWGRTLGKWLLRLRVVGPDGRPPGWKRALIRNLVLSAPWLLYVLLTVVVVATGMFITDRSVAIAVKTAFALFTWALIAQVAFTASRGRPSIHDRLAGTRVILLPRRNAMEAAGLRPAA
jgi:uncharacterized RDD family membrane protein YckC